MSPVGPPAGRVEKPTEARRPVTALRPSPAPDRDSSPGGQDVVDEIGRALGVEQEPEAEVGTSEEILRRRDRFRWHLERDAETRERREEDRRDCEALEEEGNR